MVRGLLILGLTVCGIACLAGACRSHRRPVTFDFSKAPPHQRVRSAEEEIARLTRAPSSASEPPGRQHWLNGRAINGTMTVLFSARDRPPVDAIVETGDVKLTGRKSVLNSLESQHWRYRSFIDFGRMSRLTKSGSQKLSDQNQALTADERAILRASRTDIAWVVSDYLLERQYIFSLTLEPHAQMVLRFSLWHMGIALLFLPTIALLRGPIRRYLRRRGGYCATCGYDLTGNTSGVCPECGESIPPDVVDPINEQRSGA